MSCDRNRYEYLKKLAARPDVQKALGLDERQAILALERLYQTGQSLGTRLASDSAKLAVATEQTKRLFTRMQALGIKPPTHSQDGLPRNDARFGYEKIEQLLVAIEKGKKIPGVAASVAKQIARLQPDALTKGLRRDITSGMLTALGADSKGYWRCFNCGRFASPHKEHICPATATPDKLKGMLRRRTGLPESAFEGYKMGAIDKILEEARANGAITMIHNLTGRREQVALDGLPMALVNGYIPESWNGLAVPVITNKGLNVVGVLNSSGLTQTVEHIDMVHNLGQYYGVQIPDDAPVINAYNAIKNNLKLLRNVNVRCVGTIKGVNLSGGQPYDLGHFIGTEFRKNSARGTFVKIGDRQYGVYTSSMNPMDKSSARGKFAADVNEIVIGRTLPAAIGILSEGRVSELESGKIEVYNRDGNLISVYDPSTNTAGDTLGNPNASPEQMAAVLAYRILHPVNAFDYALMRDFIQFKKGEGSPIAAADSGYLAVRSMLESGHVLQLGANVSVERCPQCGQFIGESAHTCPAEAAGKKEEASRVPEVPYEETEGPLPSPAIEQIHPASFQVPLVKEARTENIGKAVVGMRRDNDSQYDKALGLLNDFLEEQRKLVGSLSQIAIGQSVDTDRLIDKLTKAFVGASSMSHEPKGDGAERVAAQKCPRCKRLMEQDHQCPPRIERKGIQPQNNEVEQIFDGITLPAPDLYLDNVPAEWGGKLVYQLPENIPDPLSDYEMGAQERTIYNMIAMQLRKKSRRPTNRAFGIYGPAGTGKNTIARMLAASIKCDDGRQGLPYYEVNITPDADINAMIGEVVLTTDENGNTVSRARLGPIGIIAACGGVIAINEIVRSPRLATALQSLIEDGELRIPSPEGKTYKVPVHPSAIFITTWNPGYEGDADRPAQAFLSRITAMPLGYPNRDEQLRRLKRHFEEEGLDVPDDVLDAAIWFWNDLRSLTGATGQAPQIGAFSPTRTTPGPRELERFIEYGMTIGWESALLTLDIICDQEPSALEKQRAVIRERFEANFRGLIGAEQ